MTKPEIMENSILLTNEYIAKIKPVNNPSDIGGLSQDSVNLKRLQDDLLPLLSLISDIISYQDIDKEYSKSCFEMLKNKYINFVQANPDLVKEVEDKYGRNIKNRI